MKRGQSIAVERTDELGIIERRCRKCGTFMVLELFCANANCFRGRTHECKACRSLRNGYRPLGKDWARGIPRRVRVAGTKGAAV